MLAKRAEIVHHAGVSDIVRGAIVSMGPTNAVESMLVEMMGAAYNGAMRLIANASVASNVQNAIRLSHASARLMAAFTQGAETLHRLRRGPQQIVVQRVVVADGGRAVVAGSVGGGSGQPGLGENSRR